MADRGRLVELLEPLIPQLQVATEGKSDRDPLSVVLQRLERLVDLLRAREPSITKIYTLQELGYLSEHSLRAEMTDFHDVVKQTIDEAMTPDWI